MRVLAIDAATETGFVNALAGSKKPRTRIERLRRRGDDHETAWQRFGRVLCDEIEFERPDLIAFEAPLPAAAHKSGDSAEIAFGLYGIAVSYSHMAGIPFRPVKVGEVSKHFTGKGRWTEAEGGRRAKKLAAINRAKLLGYMDPECWNDNIADAIACWDFACARFAKTRPSELFLFGERAA